MIGPCAMYQSKSLVAIEQSSGQPLHEQISYHGPALERPVAHSIKGPHA
jgi:hypothetical protein